MVTATSTMAMTWVLQRQWRRQRPVLRQRDTSNGKGWGSASNKCILYYICTFVRFKTFIMHIFLKQKVNNITLSCRAKGHTNSTKHFIITRWWKIIVCCSSWSVSIARAYSQIRSKNYTLATWKHIKPPHSYTPYQYHSAARPMTEENWERENRVSRPKTTIHITHTLLTFFRLDSVISSDDARELSASL